jgi:hypothetical protein
VVFLETILILVLLGLDYLLSASYRGISELRLCMMVWVLGSTSEVGLGLL